MVITRGSGRVRKAWGSGRWFPASKGSLKTMIDGFVDQADVPAIESKIVGAIAPHAGYVYSGPVAGYTFRAIRDNARAFESPESVVVLGFSHRAAFRGVALMDGNAVTTPLGEAELDRGAASILAAKSERIYEDYGPHQGEHSAENEIPFVQATLPRAKLVVALMGDHTQPTHEALVAALLALAEKKSILVLASTDMLHDADYDRVRRTDRATLEKLAVLDEAGIKESWNSSSQVFCGIGPVLAVMAFSRKSDCSKATILHYRNSGDDHPESRGDWVVGYGAAVFAP